MAITNFIPTVWSETLLSGLDKEYIAVRNCNRDFEGDIKGKGSSVKIGSIGNISVFDYQKDTDMAAPEALSDSAVTLTINQAKAFNFQIDDIDRAQSQPKIMTAAMKQAAASLANIADKYVYTICSESDDPVTLDYETFTTEDVIDLAVTARQVLMSNGVNSNTETVLEVSPEVAAVILKAKILDQNVNTDLIENGLIGRLIGFDVFVSNNIQRVEGMTCCFARTKRAVAFAEQLNEVEAYRPENRFADAVKGLHLYGAKIVYPDELVKIAINI